MEGKRGIHQRFFSMEGDLVQWSPRIMDRPRKASLLALTISAPPQGHLSSLRTVPHAQQVLVGIRIEVRLSPFWLKQQQSKYGPSIF